jgi:membrane protein DedA with SNARE-associated domain
MKAAVVETLDHGLWITESRIKLGQYLFLRHGGKIIFIAQFIPVLRSIAGILAGANRMPWPRFMLTNIIGAFLWATLFGLAAYFAGSASRTVVGVGGVGVRYRCLNFHCCCRYLREAE